MADAAVSIACCDVTAGWSSICLLPALAQTVTFKEGSSDRLETVLACSGDPSDWIGTTSPRIWLTSYFGPNRGRRLVCLLSSSSFSKIPLLVKVISSSMLLFHLLGGHSWADLRGFSQDLGSSTFRYSPETTWRVCSRLLTSGSHGMRFVKKGCQIHSALDPFTPVAPLTLSRGFLPQFPRCQLPAHGASLGIHIFF